MSWKDVFKEYEVEMDESKLTENHPIMAEMAEEIFNLRAERDNFKKLYETSSESLTGELSSRNDTVKKLADILSKIYKHRIDWPHAMNYQFMENDEIVQSKLNLALKNFAQLQDLALNALIDARSVLRKMGL